MKLTRRHILAGCLPVGIGASEATQYSVSNLIQRSSFRFAYNPERYVDPEATDSITSFVDFQDAFESRSDPMFGLYDVVTPIKDIIKHGEGDCVDFACFAASWILRRWDEDVRVFLFRPVLDDPARPLHVAVWCYNFMFAADKTESIKPDAYADRQDFEILHSTRIENHGQFHPK